MAKKKDEITSMAGFVFKCIWLAIALLMFFAGMAGFLGEKSFGMWLFWGFCCAFPMIVQVIRDAINSAKKGAREGANQYTITQTSSTITVQNHPFKQAVISLIVSIFASILMGPIFLGLNIILAIIQIVNYIMVLTIKKKQAAMTTTKENDAR